MSRFDELATRMQLRPIVKWPAGELTSESGRQYSRFKSEWRQTKNLLYREIDLLHGNAAVLGIAMDDSDLKLNGTPKMHAKLQHPGVVLSFNPRGKAENRLEFATDAFLNWEENLRAIALSLEALRKVDRYGVTSGSQQYAGFRAITAGDDGSMGLYSATAAQRYLDEKYDGDLKQAIRDTHPDRNPDADPDELRRVLRVKALLGK